MCDSTVDLIRETRALRDDLADENLLNSGEYVKQIGRAKERALHRYRDQERTAQSQADEIRAREGRLHAFVRAWRFETLDLDLQAPALVLPVLDRWAAPISRHLGETGSPMPLESDPRTRTVESTLATAPVRAGRDRGATLEGGAVRLDPRSFR